LKYYKAKEARFYHVPQRTVDIGNSDWHDRMKSQYDANVVDQMVERAALARRMIVALGELSI